ncbi:MAG: hypothetical protein WDN00_00425 [Limisphaerales bacterium]
MSAVKANPLPIRSGITEVDAFNTIVALVRNRTGMGYTEAFNKVLSSNSDLMRPSHFQRGVENLDRLMNRSQAVTGLDLTEDIPVITEKVSKLTNRFIPEFVGAPFALQWDILWRAAEQLDTEGISERLLNKRVGDPEPDKADWKKANACADYVLSVLDSQDNAPLDRGTLQNFKQPSVSPQWCAVRLNQELKNL